MAELTAFQNFQKSELISLGLFHLKNCRFKKKKLQILQNGTIFKGFFDENEPMSMDFLWKTNPFGRHTPEYLNVRPPPKFLKSYTL